MKQVLIFTPHSFVDVITNSSTQLFVADTKKSIEVVKAALRRMISTYNEIEGTNYTLESCFNEPYRVTKDTDVEQLLHWGKYYPFLATKGRLKGRIVLMGNGDNSVPYDLWDEIRTTFNAQSAHLG